MESLDKNVAEYSSLKKAIKQIDSKIHALEKKQRIEKNYSHSQSDRLDQEIKQLKIQKRNDLKRKEKIEKKIQKQKSKLKQ